MAGNPRIRASDADRERAAALLREHHAAGRLTVEEFQERLDRAMTAKTLGELDELMADLPAIDLYELPDEALRRQVNRGRGGRGLPGGGGPRRGGSLPGGSGLPGGRGLPGSGGRYEDGGQFRGELPGDALLARGARISQGARWTEALSPGETALVAWATVALTLAIIGLITGIAAGGLSAWWVLAAIPAGAISLIWFVIRRSQR